MANEEHLAILKRGVEVWNQWREKNPKIIPEFSEADLREVDLTQVDFCKANLHGADLRQANLSGAELYGANLREADLRNADLSESDLHEAYLVKANLSGANLTRADLRDIAISQATVIEKKWLLIRHIVSHWKEGRNLNGADLSGANLQGAYLDQANLIGADLSNSDLSGAYISFANLTSANLSRASLFETNFSDSNLTEVNLSGAELHAAYFQDADLSRADLSGADIQWVDWSETILVGANLTGSRLYRVRAFGADFSHSILTGACIEDWSINSDTSLQDVNCEYIFTGYDGENEQFTDRCPHSSNQIFAPGEFTKRYQIVLDSIDLFFNDGIDWKAFLASLHDLQTQYGNELSVQGIEKKSGGAFLVRLEVPSNVDKDTIERQARELYETKLQILEAKYHSELQAKDKEIESYRRESANMMEITKLLASKPITIEAKAEAVAENQSKSATYNMQGSKFGGGFAAESGIQIGGQLIDASSKQNLVEAAQEIQQLLDQLSATYPTTTSTDRMVVAAKAVEEIENNPALKQRVVSALKAGGVEALKQLVDHPAVNILLATIEGWQNPS